MKDFTFEIVTDDLDKYEKLTDSLKECVDYGIYTIDEAYEIFESLKRNLTK